MKIRITYFLALLLTVSMISCGEEEDDNMMSTSNSALAGTWKAQSFGGSVNTSSEFGGMAVTTMANIDGKNLDYTLNMTDDSFTTNGSYDIDISLIAQGMTTMTSDQYTNVSGDGTYTSSGNQLMITGQFFELEVNGVPVMSGSGPQTATYNISGDILTVSQNEQSNSTQGGTVFTNETTFISMWQKQ